MDQFYISYQFPFLNQQPHLLSETKPIITLQEIQSLQSQSLQITLPTLVQSYISSLLIALRLHPSVISTSISSRSVKDIRNVIKVASLREQKNEWTNAEYVPKAVELCTGFRVRIDSGEECRGKEFMDVFNEVLGNVRAPF